MSRLGGIRNQAVVAAAIAWELALFFAPMAAAISLNAELGRRGRPAIEAAASAVRAIERTTRAKRPNACRRRCATSASRRAHAPRRPGAGGGAAPGHATVIT